ncbi:MAG: hypothetical protein H6Q25_1515, partial [Bacteroidetes bacterium]|nr:hypothetical protein [Bacteroidota bacterium]
MKKFLFLLLAMIFAMQSWAQSNFTAANGTSSDEFLPVYGYWMDANQHNQIIYPASFLTPLVNSTISKITFHASTAYPTSNWGTNTAVIGLASTTQSNYSSATYCTDPVTTVFTGTLTVVNNLLEITLTTPFVYSGGNLLVDIVTTTAGSGYYNHVFLDGVVSTGGGISQYGSNSPTLRDFVPKTTFAYTGGTPAVFTSAATSINATSATLNGSYYNMTTTTYGFQYMLASSTDWSTATNVAATTNPMVEIVPSLLPTTTYKFRAYANDGTSNVYGDEMTFTTLAISATLPYTCDFENPTENGQWAFINGTQANQWFIGDASLNPDVNNTLGGYNALFVTNDAGTSWAYSGASGASPSRVYAYRDIEVPIGANELKLSIDWKANGYGYGDFLRVYWVPTDAAIVAGSVPPGALDVSNALGTFYNNTNNNIHLQLDTVWLTNEFVINTTQFPNLAGNTWRLMFHWRNENTSGVAQPPATVDNISVQIVTCATPTQLVASNPTVNSVDLAWTENGTATSWIVNYKKVTETTWQTVTASTNPFTVPNLDPSSVYNFRVQSDCGTEQSLFSGIVNKATACAPVTTIPWTEGFEAITTNNELPPCWVSTNLGNYTYTQIADYSYYNRFARSGTKSAYFRYGCNDRFYTVGIQLTAGVSYDFSFWYITDGYSGWNTLESGVYSAQTTDSLIQTIATVTSLTNTSYQKLLGSFTPTVDGVYYFGVYCQSSYNPMYLTIDDFSVNVSPTCLGPVNALATNIMPTTADVVFSPGDPNTINYQIFWKPAASTTWLQDDIMGDTTYTLTALTPNTIYNVKIAADCNDATYSNFTEFNFRSACDVNTVLPYTESFDTYGGGSYTNYPSCWTRLSTYGSYPYIYNYDYFSSPGSLYLYCYNNTYTLASINDFDATIPMNSLKVNFKMMGWSTSYNMKVGIMTNPADRNTFVQVGATQTLNSTGVWEDKEVILSSYAGTGRYITFLVEDVAGNTNYMYLDNVVVDELPPCPNVYNFNTEVSSTTSFSVNFDNSTDDGTGFVLSYVVNPTTLPFDPETGTQVNIPTGTALPFAVGSLNPGDTVYAAVKAACGSPWTTVQSVILPTIISPVPYTCNFEDTTQNATWTLSNGTQPNIWYIGAPGANGGAGNGLYISNDNGATASYNNTVASTVMASTYIQFNNANEFAFSFDWANYGESGYDFVIAYLVPLSYTITPGTMIPDAYRVTPNLNSSSAWQTHNVVLGSQYSNTVKRLVFQWRNDTSAGSPPPGLVDNVSIQPLTCASPHGLVYSNVTAYTADLTWNNFPVGAEYVIEYKEASASVWNQISTLDTTYQLPLLTPSTTYNARIKAVCTPGDTSFASNMVTFTTACVALVPPTIAEPFATMTPSICWTLKQGLLPATGNANLSPITYGWTTRTSLGQSTAAVNMYSTSCQYWLITPSIDLGTGTSQYQLEFDLAITDYYNSSVSNMDLSPNARFVVLISTDNGNTWNSTGILKDWNNSTGIPFSTLNNTLQNQTIPLYDSVAMAPYSGIVKFAFFAFENDGSYTYDNDLHIDNFKVMPFNPCMTPTLLNVSNITANTVTLDWTEPSTSTAWNIEYGPAGFTQGTGTVVPVTSHPFIVPGLTDATMYDFYVQSDCGSGNFSNWSSKITATTTCLPITTLPWNEGFESITTTNQLPACWSSTNLGTYTYTQTSDYTSYNRVAHTGTKAAYFRYGCDDRFFSPGFQLTAGTAYQFSYWYITDGYTGWNTLELGAYSGQTAATLVQAINTVTSPTNGTYVQVIASFTPTTSGVYYFGIYCQANGVPWYLTFDDLSLTVGAPVCAIPTNLAVSGVTSSTATATWTAGGSETQWEIAYKPTADATWMTAIVNTTPTYILPSLTANTPYDVKVRAICGAGDSSSYTAVVNFTTLQTLCNAPTGLAVSNITNTGASVNWVNGGTETAWEIDYKLTAASTWTTVPVTSHPFAFTGLTTCSDYDVRVRAMCAAGVYSDYTAVVNFTTPTPAPTNVQIIPASITDQGGTVTWTAGGTETQWIVEYKLASSTNWTTSNVLTTTTYPIV